MDDENIVSSVAGHIELVNKLISVRPVRTRCVSPQSLWPWQTLIRHSYNPEVGDLVVGRVSEVDRL